MKELKEMPIHFASPFAIQRCGALELGLKGSTCLPEVIHSLLQNGSCVFHFSTLTARILRYRRATAQLSSIGLQMLWLTSALSRRCERSDHVRPLKICWMNKCRFTAIPLATRNRMRADTETNQLLVRAVQSAFTPEYCALGASSSFFPKPYRTPKSGVRRLFSTYQKFEEGEDATLGSRVD